MPPQPIGWTFAKTGRQRAIEDKRGIVQIAAQKNKSKLRCNGKNHCLAVLLFFECLFPRCANVRRGTNASLQALIFCFAGIANDGIR